VRISFRAYLHRGALRGHGSARLDVGRGAYASFAGSLTISRGSGRYRHARGSGNIYGTLSRNDDSAVVQAIGSMSY
jgi:hypothetical protein